MASELHVDAIKHSGGTSALTIDSSGRVLQPSVPAFRVGLSSNQSITQAGTFIDVVGMKAQLQNQITVLVKVVFLGVVE